MHSFHHLDAALPGLSASCVIMACNSALATIGLGMHRSVRSVLAQGMSRAAARDYQAALDFVAGFIAPIQIDDATGDIDREALIEFLTAARNAAAAVQTVRQAKSRLSIETAA